jgi:hypothetical protein
VDGEGDPGEGDSGCGESEKDSGCAHGDGCGPKQLHRASLQAWRQGGSRQQSATEAPAAFGDIISSLAVACGSRDFHHGLPGVKVEEFRLRRQCQPPAVPPVLNSGLILA